MNTPGSRANKALKEAAQKYRRFHNAKVFSTTILAGILLGEGIAQLVLDLPLHIPVSLGLMTPPIVMFIFARQRAQTHLERAIYIQNSLYSGDYLKLFEDKP